MRILTQQHPSRAARRKRRVVEERARLWVNTAPGVGISISSGTLEIAFVEEGCVSHSLTVTLGGAGDGAPFDPIANYRDLESFWGKVATDRFPIRWCEIRGDIAETTAGFIAPDGSCSTDDLDTLVWAISMLDNRAFEQVVCLGASNRLMVTALLMSLSSLASIAGIDEIVWPQQLVEPDSKITWNGLDTVVTAVDIDDALLLTPTPLTTPADLRTMFPDPVDRFKPMDEDVEEFQLFGFSGDDTVVSIMPPPPRIRLRIRDVLAAILLTAVVTCPPLILNEDLRLKVWFVEGGISLVMGGYILGRWLSNRFGAFSFRAVFRRIGQLLFGDPLTTVAATLLAFGVIFVLLPSSLNLDRSQEEKTTKGNVPSAALRSAQKMTEVALGESISSEGLKVTAHDLTVKFADSFIETKKPDPGYRWVVISVTASALNKPVDITKSTIKLVDNTNRVYLPDLGEGVNNAEEGLVTSPVTAFWNVGFQVAVDAKPTRVEFSPSQTSQRLLRFSFAKKPAPAAPR